MDTWSLWHLQESLTQRRLGGEMALFEDARSVSSTENTVSSVWTTEDILDARIEAYQDYLESLDPEEEDD
jgi:hypothetical protein